MDALQVPEAAVRGLSLKLIIYKIFYRNEY